MSLSDKERRQLQAKRIRHLKYKATGLYLYHPATDSWIPAQCDDEGRLVIDPSDLDTRYHKKNEDVDIDTHALLTEYAALLDKAADWVKLMNRAQTAYHGLWLKNLTAESNLFAYHFRPTTAKLPLILATYGDVEVGRIGTTYFDISKAGDITFNAEKTLHIGNIIDTLVPSVSTRVIPVQDGNTTRYIRIWDET